jgi:hypothetical protein
VRVLLGDTKSFSDDPRKQKQTLQQDVVKLFEAPGRENLKVPSTVRDFSVTFVTEEMSVQTRIKELLLRLEHRERDLLLNHDLVASKLCQLSRKSFIHFVELFLGERKEPSFPALQSLPVHVTVMSEISTEPLAKG